MLHGFVVHHRETPHNGCTVRRKQAAHKKSRARGPAFLVQTVASGLGRLRGRVGTVDELHQRHRRGVALPITELQDAQVTTGTRLVARAELVEELGDDVAVAQPVERKTPMRERRLLG